MVAYVREKILSMAWVVWIRSLVVLGFVLSVFGDDSFSEELYIKPLSNGYVYSHFRFSLLWNVDVFAEKSRDHYHLFPKSLGETLSRYNVRELHLSLTQGLWKHKHWGYPVEDAPPGLELWVWFHEWTEDVDTNWFELTHSLSGLFCASLNFIDKTNSVSPKFLFRPKGIASKNYTANSQKYLRYSILPRENVCTENLTPWTKLLPCGSKAGLAKLLNSGHIFNTNYLSLAIHVRPKCRTSKCTETSLELSQTVSLVSELAHKNNGKQDWNFSKLFGALLLSSCPVADISSIYVDITKNETEDKFVLSPLPSAITSASRGGHKRQLAFYDIKNLNLSSPLSISAKYQNTVIYGFVNPPPLHMHRFLTGFGQEGGGIRCQIRNTQFRQSQSVIYMEVIPWYFRLFLHSLTIKNGHEIIKPTSINYTPSRDRERATLLEIAFTLPPNSITTLNWEFERTMLKWTEYPPDANHGFYMGSAVLVTNLDSAKNYSSLLPQDTTLKDSFISTHSTYFLQLHSEQLLILLPTPDFSMPYNVICLTCTVVAIAFGPLHNLTTKNLQVDPDKPTLEKRIRNKIMSWLKREKKTTEKKSENVSK